jgi:lysophospholipid acyltransferase (LPLAT)-like uncharacterized protein
VAAARRDGGPVLYCFTHGVLLPLAFTHRRRGIQVLISESRDGEMIARVVERLGFGTVRGSSSRGGLRALAELIARGREGRDLAVTPDGPRGPRGSAEPGAVIVAAKAGVPLVPVGVAAGAAWRAKSWDRFLVPKPFARVWVVYGTAIGVVEGDVGRAADLSRELERAMAAVEAEAESCARGRCADADASGVPA